MPNSGAWFEVLKSARRLSPDDSRNFTAAELAAAAGIEATRASGASQIATAWLSKFVKWGYARVVGKEPGLAGRAVSSYALTDQGRECELKEGCEAHLLRLLREIRALQAAKGRKDASLARLTEAADEADKWLRAREES